MNNWEKITAEEFCTKVTDGTHDSPKGKSSGYKLITSKNLKEYEIDFQSAKYISESDYQKIILRSFVEQGDILFSMIGTIGNIYLEKNICPQYACKNVGIFKFGGDMDKAYWMYYFLKSSLAKAYINAQLCGSTQSYISLGSLRNFPVIIPPMEIRNNIVSILKTIDDKILVNRKINDNLRIA